MKKTLWFFVLTIIVFTTNSCSNDDSSDVVNGLITMKVNGVYKSFTKIHLKQTKSPDGRDTSLSIYTEDDGDDYGDWVSVTFTKGIYSDVGPFSYWIEDEKYDRAPNFAIQITSNGNDRKLIGSFSGDVTGTGGTISITEGTFDIQY